MCIFGLVTTCRLSISYGDEQGFPAGRPRNAIHIWVRGSGVVSVLKILLSRATRLSRQILLGDRCGPGRSRLLHWYSSITADVHTTVVKVTCTLGDMIEKPGPTRTLPQGPAPSDERASQIGRVLRVRNLGLRSFCKTLKNNLISLAVNPPRRSRGALRKCTPNECVLHNRSAMLSFTPCHLTKEPLDAHSSHVRRFCRLHNCFENLSCALFHFQ